MRLSTYSRRAFIAAEESWGGKSAALHLLKVKGCIMEIDYAVIIAAELL